MGQKENQRVALTKRLLKESLIRLMEKKSIQKISVSELCEGAGINRTTFYNHYGSQFDLLRDLKGDMIADLDRIWREQAEDPEWTLAKRTESICTYIKEHERVVKLMFRNEDADTEFASLLFRSPQVQAYYQKGLSKAADPDSLKLIATFFMNGIYSLIRQWILEDIPKTPKEMGELVSGIDQFGWEYMVEVMRSL